MRDLAKNKEEPPCKDGTYYSYTTDLQNGFEVVLFNFLKYFLLQRDE